MANIQYYGDDDFRSLSPLFRSRSIQLQAGTVITLDYGFEEVSRVSFNFVGACDLQNALENYRGLGEFEFAGQTFYISAGSQTTITPLKNFQTVISAENILSYLLNALVKSYADIPRRGDIRLYTIENPFGDINKTLLEKLKLYCNIQFDNAGSREAEKFYPPAEKLTYLDALRQKSLLNKEYLDLTTNIITTRRLNLDDIFYVSNKDIIGNINVAYTVDIGSSVLLNDTFIVPDQIEEFSGLLELDYATQPFVRSPLNLRGNIGDNLQEDLRPDLLANRLPDSLLIRSPRLELNRLKGNYKTKLPDPESYFRRSYNRSNTNLDIPEIEFQLCILPIRYDPRIETSLGISPGFLTSYFCTSGIKEEVYEDIAYPNPSCFSFERGQFTPVTGLISQGVDQSQLGLTYFQNIPDPEYMIGNPTIYEGGPTSERTVECVFGNGKPKEQSYERFGFIHGDFLIGYSGVNNISLSGMSVFGNRRIPYPITYNELLTVNDVNIASTSGSNSFQGINKWSRTDQQVTVYNYKEIPFPHVVSKTGKKAKYLQSVFKEGEKYVQITKSQNKAYEKESVFELIRGYNQITEKYNNLDTQNINVATQKDLLDFLANSYRGLIKEAADLNGTSLNIITFAESFLNESSGSNNTSGLIKYIRDSINLGSLITSRLVTQLSLIGVKSASTAVKNKLDREIDFNALPLALAKFGFMEDPARTERVLLAMFGTSGGQIDRNSQASYDNYQNALVPEMKELYKSIMATVYRKIIRLAYTQYNNFVSKTQGLTFYQIESATKIYGSRITDVMQRNTNLTLAQTLNKEIEDNTNRLKLYFNKFLSRKQKIEQSLFNATRLRTNLINFLKSIETVDQTINDYQNTRGQLNIDLDLYFNALADRITLINQRDGFYSNLYSSQTSLNGLYKDLSARQLERNNLLNLININNNRINRINNFTLPQLQFERDELVNKLNEVNDVSVIGIVHPYSAGQINSQIAAKDVEITNATTERNNLTTDNTNISTVQIPIVDLQINNITNSIILEQSNYNLTQIDINNITIDINNLQTVINNNRSVLDRIPTASNYTNLSPVNLTNDFRGVYTTIDLFGVQDIPQHIIPQLNPSFSLPLCSLDDSDSSTACRQRCNPDLNVDLISDKVLLNQDIQTYTQQYINELNTTQLNLNTLKNILDTTQANSNTGLFDSRFNTYSGILASLQGARNVLDSITQNLLVNETNYQTNLNLYNYYVEEYQFFINLIDRLTAMFNQSQTEISFYTNEQALSSIPVQDAKYQQFIDRRLNVLFVDITNRANIASTESNNSFTQLNFYNTQTNSFLPTVNQLKIDQFNQENLISDLTISLTNAKTLFDTSSNLQSLFYTAQRNYYTEVINFNAGYYTFYRNFISLREKIVRFGYELYIGELNCYNDEIQDLNNVIIQSIEDITDLYKQLDNAKLGDENEPFYIMKEFNIETTAIPEFGFQREQKYYFNGELIRDDNLNQRVFLNATNLPSNESLVYLQNDPIDSDNPIIWKTGVDERTIIKSYFVSGDYTIETTKTLEKRNDIERSSTVTRAYLGTPPIVDAVFDQKTQRVDPQQNLNDKNKAEIQKELDEYKKKITELNKQITEFNKERDFVQNELQREYDVLLRNKQLELQRYQRQLEINDPENINVPGRFLRLENIQNDIENRKIQITNLQRVKERESKLDICQQLQVRDVTRRGSQSYPFANTREELITCYCSDMTKQSYNSVRVSFEIPQNLNIKPGKIIMLDNLNLVVLRVSHLFRVVSGGRFVLTSAISCGLNRGVGNVPGYFNIPLDSELISTLDIIYDN